ncbi:MAG: hypothetical protein ACO1PB_03740 [Ramlibacter sp.]
MTLRGIAGSTASPEVFQMYQFLKNNRDELIERCKAKVARRPRRAATAEQLKNGVPLFLEQLAKTLEAEKEGHAGDSFRISGAPGGVLSTPSEIGLSATAHGAQRNVEAAGGTLGVRNVPGSGCVFTIALRRHG